jgi:hypothetical protein
MPGMFRFGFSQPDVVRTTYGRHGLERIRDAAQPDLISG